MPGFVARGGIKLGEFAVIVNGVSSRLFNGVVHLHNGRLVTTSVAIVGSGENRDYLAIVLPLVAFHDQLVSTRNKVQPVNVCELLGDILAKSVASAAW